MGGIIRLLTRLPKAQALAFGERVAARLGVKRAFTTLDDVAKFIIGHARRNPMIYGTIGSVAAAMGIDFAIDELREAFNEDVPATRTGAGARSLELGLAAIANMLAASDARVERNAGDGDPKTIYGTDADEYQAKFLAQQAEVQWIQGMARQYGGFEALRNLQRLVNTEPRVIDIAEASTIQARQFS